MSSWGWPSTAEELTALQTELAAANRHARLWDPPVDPLIAGCFVAFARGEAGPGRPGDRAWGAGVAWRLPPASATIRRSDDRLRGVVQGEEPRQARDVTAQAVVRGQVPASYRPGFLALREGEILAAALEALPVRPDVVLVDATGLDHPRRAGLAVHLGAVLETPSIGVTHRSLIARGVPPGFERGQRAPVLLDGELVGFWVCTRTGARPVLVHAGWRTDPATAAELVLVASTEGARTPVPLQEARRVAREARTLAGR